MEKLYMDMSLENIANDSWHTLFNEGFITIYNKSLMHAPQIIGSILLLLVGIICSMFLQYLTNKIISSLDSLFSKFSGGSYRQKFIVQKSYAYIISKIVFIIVFILFLNASANLLDWKLLLQLMNHLTSYIPNVIAGSLLLLLGFLFSIFVKNIILKTNNDETEKNNVFFASLSQWGIMIIVILLSVQQLGININVLNNILVVILGISLGGGVLIFCIGSKSLISNLIGAQYAKKYCTIGEHILIGNINGKLIDIKQTTIFVETDNSITMIPAKIFNNEIITLNKTQ